MGLIAINNAEASIIDKKELITVSYTHLCCYFAVKDNYMSTIVSIPDRTGQRSVFKDTVFSGFSLESACLFNTSSNVTDYSGNQQGINTAIQRRSSQLLSGDYTVRFEILLSLIHI